MVFSFSKNTPAQRPGGNAFVPGSFCLSEPSTAETRAVQPRSAKHPAAGGCQKAALWTPASPRVARFGLGCACMYKLEHCFPAGMKSAITTSPSPGGESSGSSLCCPGISALWAEISVLLTQLKNGQGLSFLTGFCPLPWVQIPAL